MAVASLSMFNLTLFIHAINNAFDLFVGYVVTVLDG